MSCLEPENLLLDPIYCKQTVGYEKQSSGFHSDDTTHNSSSMPHD